ncbi:glyoxalase family protein [Pseudopedobacter saltans DSM 12145]|uniref:Glyoxalase family protein n=1 Tax=Pseudopedobacter saltans (strain ATCC 51119 / DSM 12145 / JCM 21818 / CCUG 39354 / LMG 10337 / NBRC 100064 / NCIMB 13643) TaxID=762903 RepID=F0SC58_PSESL|nr:VOC family protein [Pseudopedobacter saltans]ADY50643.1 glyoxalase family protein [Pseudopedobacter saltans DSM 12145]
MVNIETIIAVRDIQQSSLFYQNLLGCKSAHGGDTFEILKDNDKVILCLHRWGEHDHPTMRNPTEKVGNGVILFFRVDDIKAIFSSAKNLNANIEKEIHYNENSLKNQFSLWDPDDYYLIVSE